MSVSPLKKKPVLPINVFPLAGSSPPYANAKPTDQKPNAPMAVEEKTYKFKSSQKSRLIDHPNSPPAESSKFQRRTFFTFFSRIEPAQSMAKPDTQRIGWWGQFRPSIVGTN